MADVKLTQLETSDDFEQALLYGVDKEGKSKAFKAGELAKLGKQDDLFAQAEQLEASYETNVYYNSPSKVKIPLGTCKIYDGQNDQWNNLRSFDIGIGAMCMDWSSWMRDYSEFQIAIPLPQGTKSCIMGVTHYNTKNIQNQSMDVHSDETFDSKNYDFMLLVHSKTYVTAKRLSERIKHDESEHLENNGYNRPMYIKGHQLYHESNMLSGYITSSNYFYLKYMPTEIGYDSMSENDRITREAVFNVFPGYYLRWANIINIDNQLYLGLHFQRNSFYTTTDNSDFVKFTYGWLNNMVIPNIVFDMYFKYEE